MIFTSRNQRNKQREKEERARITNQIFQEHPEIQKFLLAKEKCLRILIVVGLAIHIAWYIASGLWRQPSFSSLLWIGAHSIFLYAFSLKTAVMPGLLLLMNLLIWFLELLSYGLFMIATGETASFFKTGTVLCCFLTILFHLTVLVVSIILCLPKYSKMMRLFYKQFKAGLQTSYAEDQKAIFQNTQQFDAVLRASRPDLWNWLQKTWKWSRILMLAGNAAHIFWFLSRAMVLIRYLDWRTSALPYLFSMFFWVLIVFALRSCFNQDPKKPLFPLFLSGFIFVAQLFPSVFLNFGDTPVQICFLFLRNLWTVPSGAATGGIPANGLALPYSEVTLICSVCITLLFLLAFTAIIILILPKNRMQMQQIFDLAQDPAYAPQEHDIKDNEENF